MNNALKYVRQHFVYIFLASVVLGALLPLLYGQGEFLPGWLAATVLLLPGLLLAVFLWRWAGGGRPLFAMMLAALLLRLLVGGIFVRTLPVLGYPDEETNRMGYVFYDAFIRDGQAWDLASSDQPLSLAFGNNLISDQYGGLLWVSALIYRVLSPDAPRPFLVVLLGALVFTLGLAFYWKAVRARWGDQIVRWSGWILALYPAAVELGASQMREPFLMGFICVGMWGAGRLAERDRKGWIGMAVALLGLGLFSWRVAAPVAAVLALWVLIDGFGGKHLRKIPAWGWLLILAAAVLIGLGIWPWFRESMLWDIHTTVDRSGWLQKVFRMFGDGAQIPFLTIYGLFQPVLPAALTDPAAPFWQTLGSVLALGWYLIGPVVVYSFFTIWKVQDKRDRRILIFTAAALAVWMLVASIRAGGDQFDNPRYRTIFLPWMALLAAWAVTWARSHRDPWLTRWLIVEGIFLAFFTQWYGSRKVGGWWGGRLDFRLMVGLIVLFSLAVLVGGWWWDRRKRRS